LVQLEKGELSLLVVLIITHVVDVPMQESHQLLRVLPRKFNVKLVVFGAAAALTTIIRVSSLLLIIIIIVFF
jgi:hypothetical protein